MTGGDSISILVGRAGITPFQNYIPELDRIGKKVLCLLHGDTNTPNFSLTDKSGKITGKCFACNWQGDGLDFIQAVEGINRAKGIERLRAISGNGSKPEQHKADNKQAKTLTLQQIKALEPEPGYKYIRHHVYITGNPPYIKALYRNEIGDKTARFFTITGENRYQWNRQGNAVLYNQAALRERPSDVVYYPEGEKDSDSLSALGLLSVTAGAANDFGEKTNRHLAEHFRGRDVVLLPDNDAPGRACMQKIAGLLQGVAASIKIVELPGLPVKGDVSDWMEQQKAGGKDSETINGELQAIIEDTPEWKPEAEPSLIDSLLRWDDIPCLDVSTEYLLTGLLPKGSITLLFGRGGVGKTSLCMQIARAIAGGLSFGDLMTIKTPVYYIDFENPLSVLKARVELIGRSENLYVWHISNTPQPPKLDSNTWELYKKLPPGLLIFDTLRAAHLSDENDSKPMSMIMGRLKELREIGFSVLLLHHSPKNNDDTFKGSTALLDLCDHVLGLQEVKAEDTERVEFDCHNLYRLGVRMKTRYEPFLTHLVFDPAIKGFRIATDPDIDRMHGIVEILNSYNRPVKQKELKNRAIEELDLSDREARRLLTKGDGLYWQTMKGDKNATLFIPKNPVCQLDTPIGADKQTNRQFDHLGDLTNRHDVNTEQTLTSVEFGSLTDTLCQTDKQTESCLSQGCKKTDVSDKQAGVIDVLEVLE